MGKELDSLEASCALCLETTPREDLDRLLWCDACVADAKAKSFVQSWYVAVVVAVALALWIWLDVQPSLLIGGWVGVVVAALYMSSRVARELIYGVARMRGRAAHLRGTPEEPAG
jgi:hypothetical protein